MDIRNKRIVITGATSGIGRQLMLLLSKYEGTKIIAVGRQMRHIPIAMNIIPFKTELSEEEGIDALFNFAETEMGGIDIFISNAGAFYCHTHETAQWDDFESMFKTNVFASIYATKKMLELHKGTDSEFLVAITASGLAKLPLPGNPVYMGTKSALEGFIQGVRFEFPPQGHLMGVYPIGVRRISMWEESPMKRWMLHWLQTPRDVARAIIRGIEKNKKSIYPTPLARTAVYLFNAFPFISNWYSRMTTKQLSATAG